MERIVPGEKIKELRLRAALSQEELAEVSGLSLRSIQRIENDQTFPRGDSLKRIAKALGVGVEELTEEPEMNHIHPLITLKEDPGIPLILILSALGYLLNPVLGVILPSLIWVLYKNTVANVREFGLKIIKFESAWCAILIFIYAYIFSKKFFHWNLPVPDNNKLFLLLIPVLYIVNFCVIASILFIWLRRTRTMQKA